MRALTMEKWAILDELLGDDLWQDFPDISTLEIISRVCSESAPTGTFAAQSEADQLRDANVLLHGFDLDAEQLAWRAYFDACFLSAPRLRGSVGGGGADFRAPIMLGICTFILRKSHFTFSELWSELPRSQVAWIYESLREQESGTTHIAETDEPPAPPTAEEIAAEEKHRALAEKVFADYAEKSASYIAIFNTDGTATFKAELDALITTRDARLALAIAGKLGEDLEESHE